MSEPTERRVTAFDEILAPRRKNIEKHAEMLALFEEDPKTGQKILFGYKGVAVKGTILEFDPDADPYNHVRAGTVTLTVEAKVIADSTTGEIDREPRIMNISLPCGSEFADTGRQTLLFTDGFDAERSVKDSPIYALVGIGQQGIDDMYAGIVELAPNANAMQGGKAAAALLYLHESGYVLDDEPL